MAATNQIIAPEGYGPLTSGVTHHVIRNDRANGRVILASFPAKPGAKLHVLSSSSYEDGLANRALRFGDKTLTLPPWLADLEGMNFERLDEERGPKVRSHKRLVEQRLGHIMPLREKVGQIFASAEPEKEMNKLARERGQNETRVRTWFLVYLAFGHNSWALLPPFHHNGGWCRNEKYKEARDKKFGRAHVGGKRHGYPCTEDMQNIIAEGYGLHARIGRTMIVVYTLTMLRQFGCKTKDGENGHVEYYHPQGKPYPSLNQFVYWSKKILGKSTVQITLYGAQRYRNKLQSSKGKFSEELANLMTKVEADAYTTDKHPRSFKSKMVPLPKLYVVVVQCCTSGLRVGIGFGWGAESQAAYKAALFCMAIDKVLFCELFGIEIEEDDWPPRGMPHHYTPDNGAGAAEGVFESLVGVVSVVEMPPAYTPQSHAGIESSHPRQVHVQGAPTYEISALTAPGMVRCEIRKLLRANESGSALSRMTPEMIQAKIPATPLGVWRYMSARGRIDSQNIALEDAIRRFLEPVDFIVEDGQPYLAKLRYGSDEFAVAYAAAGMPAKGSVKVKGYALPMCVRYTWIEIKGQLVRVGAILSVRDDDEQLYMSMKELEEYEVDVRAATRAQKAGRSPALAKEIQSVEADTGHKYEAATRRRGRAKARRPAAVSEMRAASPHDFGGGRA